MKLKLKRKPGRPQRGAEPADCKITISCTKSDAERLDRYCTALPYSPSRSMFIMNVIREFLDAEGGSKP